jgi:hypothetical protein
LFLGNVVTITCVSAGACELAGGSGMLMTGARDSPHSWRDPGELVNRSPQIQLSCPVFAHPEDLPGLEVAARRHRFHSRDYARVQIHAASVVEENRGLVPGGTENIAYMSIFFEDNVLCHIHPNWLASVVRAADDARWQHREQRKDPSVQ